jgi:hypothetical protein
MIFVLDARSLCAAADAMAGRVFFFFGVGGSDPLEVEVSR